MKAFKSDRDEGPYFFMTLIRENMTIGVYQALLIEVIIELKIRLKTLGRRQ